MLDKKIAPWLLLFIASLFYDGWLMLSITRTTVTNAVFVFLTNYASTIAVFFLASIILLLKNKRLLMHFVASFAATGLAVVILKVIVLRPRPFAILPIEKIVGITYDFASWNSSFPSWHAASVFVALPFISKSFPRLKWYWFAFALLVSFSRVYVGVHYVSDVIAGGLIGYVLGYSLIRLGIKKPHGKNL